MANRKRKSSKAGAFGNPKPRRADALQSGRDTALTSSLDYVKRASDRTEKGDLHGALSDAERAVELNPKDADAYLSPNPTEAMGRGDDTKDDGQGKANGPGPIPIEGMRAA